MYVLMCVIKCFTMNNIFKTCFSAHTCTLGECSNESPCDIEPLEVGGRTAGVWILRSREKLKVVIAVDLAVHEGSSCVQVAGSCSSQWGIIYSASFDMNVYLHKGLI